MAHTATITLKKKEEPKIEEPIVEEQAPETPEEQKLREQAEEWIKNGKGRPPAALYPKIKEIRRNRQRALRKLKEYNPKGGRPTEDEKIEAFLEEFMKNGGNATQAALAVNPTTSIATAANLGSYYLKRVRGVAQIHLEKKGYGYGKMMEVATRKMEESKTPEWWDRLMKMAGYEDFITKKVTGGPAVVNIVGAHKKDVDEFGFAEEGQVIGETNDTEEV